MAMDRQPDELLALDRRIDRLEAVEAIRRLQFAYGYFLDKWLYDEALACFAEAGEFHFTNGIFRGRDHGLRRFYCDMLKTHWGSWTPPVHGALVDHPVMQDVITISEDGDHAFGRFRFIEFVGVHVSNTETRIKPPDHPWEGPDAERQWIGGCLYENEYVREDGIWKIAKIQYSVDWNVPWEKGWAHAETSLPQFEKLYPDDPLGPDAFRAAPPMWPETHITPFHFNHPVTGEKVGKG